MSCTSSDPPTFCSNAPDLKLYQIFIFSVPVMFTFVLLLLFYLFYLRRRRTNWASLRMRASYLARGEMSRVSESGIKKEVREMLPVVVFGESFLIRETQCSVCLGDYKSDEWLKRIPPCGHTFHVDCIDHWLTTHTTCPLCRVSLVPATKAATDPVNLEGEANVLGNTPNVIGNMANEGDQAEQRLDRDSDGRPLPHRNGTEETERASHNEEHVCTRRRIEECRSNGDGSVIIEVASHGTSQGNSTI